MQASVIAGAMAIPTDLKEATEAFRLVTGLVTAAGGAWNASIVAEYVHFEGTDNIDSRAWRDDQLCDRRGDLQAVVGGNILMAAVVVTVDRTLWRPMYRPAETRFRLEG